MKKGLFCFLLMAQAIVNGQVSIADKINTLITNHGCGIVNVSINYSSTNYWSRESVLILKDSAASSTIKIHACFVDSNHIKIDTAFVLSSAQLNNLKSFYQSVKNNTNPNPSLSAQHTGQALMRITMGCDDHHDVSFSSSLHISLFRTILGNWINWYQ